MRCDLISVIEEDIVK